MSKRLLFTLFAVGCGAASVNFDYAKEPDPRHSEFVIGVSDRLMITVWKNPELTTDATVRPDGTITMPLLGDLTAAGKTPGDLKKEVRGALERYVKDDSAVVTVAVTTVNSYNFTVSGNVEHPGFFTANHYVTVIEAVQLAGGLNRFASPGEVVLLRRDAASPRKIRRIPIDYREVQSGERPDANLALMPGDSLYVP
jgi:polysaccharide export outer membrane protein